MRKLHHSDTEKKYAKNFSVTLCLCGEMFLVCLP
jgi:hypothetical protein